MVTALNMVANIVKADSPWFDTMRWEWVQVNELHFLPLSLRRYVSHKAVHFAITIFTKSRVQEFPYINLKTFIVESWSFRLFESPWPVVLLYQNHLEDLLKQFASPHPQEFFIQGVSDGAWGASVFKNFCPRPRSNNKLLWMITLSL